MNVYIDPSEAAETSRLPGDVLEVSTPMPRLERTTGADILVTPLQVTKITNAPAHLEAFRQACEFGLLVQRKARNDFLASIPHLSSIKRRMQEWTIRPWLLIIGDLHERSPGGVTMDGESFGWSWGAVQGSLEAWQDPGMLDLRPGGLTILHRDDQILPWLERWGRKLEKRMEEGLSAPKPMARRPHVMPESAEDLDRLGFVACIPGVGPVRARAALEASGSGKIVDALDVLTDPDWGPKVRDIGPGTVRAVREFVGLREGESWRVVLDSHWDERWKEEKEKEGRK